ncbi:hypothetical protein [Engelhardtia mirabilis]|uniref:Uncharacterized protein n=1 Tax=Engelhardtia mirabilis TaxID=2528011 RepID=A0A518BT03_9BACT|nr:hypothetical protein Pla133_52220 [Planctomycetes bacterium Pla133]QDV04424.1 hypothetical protein Pla86_52190 [Planctomycetes bacterium Pla86]
MPQIRPRVASVVVGSSLLLGPAFLGFLALGPGTSATAAGPPTTIVDASRELFITDVRVVDAPGHTDAGGDWHFGTMMERLAGSVPVDEFVTDWVQTWFSPQMVNGFPVFTSQHRASLLTFASAWAGLGLTPTGHLDPDVAPFRLLAIVNRPDLLKVDGGQVESAGEMRFVFGAYNPENSEQIRNLTVIFEFKVPAESCADVTAWHQRWHDLADHQIGTVDYLTELSQMTRDVVLPDPTSGLPNESHIGQVRTNNFMSVTFWELREFNIDPVAGSSNLGRLINVTTKQTPHFEYLDDPDPSNPAAPSRDVLREFLDTNASQIDNGIHVVPDSFASTVAGQTVSFQTGRAENSEFHPLPPGLPFSTAPGTRWWTETYGDSGTTASNLQRRHMFALQTCAGCHREETKTGFQMVAPRKHGVESVVSTFITGGGAAFPDVFDPNPSNPTVVHGPFNDLANRELQFIRILELDCSSPAEGGLTPVGVLEDVAASIGTRVH